MICDLASQQDFLSLVRKPGRDLEFAETVLNGVGKLQLFRSAPILCQSR